MIQRNVYIDADKLQEIRDAWGMGVPLSRLAAQAGTDEQTLRQLLGIPAWKAEPPRDPQKLIWEDTPNG